MIITIILLSATVGFTVATVQTVKKRKQIEREIVQLNKNRELLIRQLRGL